MTEFLEGRKLFPPLTKSIFNACYPQSQSEKALKMLFIFAPQQMMNCDPERDLIWLSGIKVTFWIFSLSELHPHKRTLTLCLVKITPSRLAKSSVFATKPLKKLIFPFLFASKLIN